MKQYYIAIIIFIILLCTDCRGFCQNISKAQKEAVRSKVERLMLTNGYSSTQIKQTIKNIRRCFNYENLAPSFYIFIEKKYWLKYFDGGYYCSDLFNETKLSKINNFIDDLVTYQYSDEDIKLLAEYAGYRPPSFNVALKKKYLGKYIFVDSDKEFYLSKEKYISRMVNLVDFMVASKNSSTDIFYTVNGIRWVDIENDNFSKSFYTAIEKKYIPKYINPYYVSVKHFTNEKIMNELNKVVEQMIIRGYSEDDIKTTINYISRFELSKSFFTAIEKGYLVKYINTNRWRGGFVNENAMLNKNNVIEKMLDYGYSDIDIKDTVEYIGSGNIPKSFYTSIEKHYLIKYISLKDIQGLFNPIYYESAMTKINNYIEFLNKKGVSDSNIKKIVSSIEWERGFVDYDALCLISSAVLDSPQINEKKKVFLLSDMFSRPRCMSVINNKNLSEIEKYTEIIKAYNYSKRIEKAETMADIQSMIQDASQFVLKLMDVGSAAYEKYQRFNDMKNGNWLGL